MNTRKTFEAIIGFVILLICSLLLIHIVSFNQSAKSSKYNNILYANFNNIDGIKIGSEVKISGISIGYVEKMVLNNETYQVKVRLNIKNDIKIPNDSTIAVNSESLLGGKFLSIKIGASEEFLQNGDSFVATQSSMNLEDLIGKVVASIGG